jgi:NSS family neurotransmitter:Na+ symporter
VLSWLMTRIPWSAGSRASQQSPAPPILDSVLDRRLLGTTGYSHLDEGTDSPWAHEARHRSCAETEENAR